MTEYIFEVSMYVILLSSLTCNNQLQLHQVNKKSKH